MAMGFTGEQFHQLTNDVVIKGTAEAIVESEFKKLKIEKNGDWKTICPNEGKHHALQNIPQYSISFIETKKGVAFVLDATYTEGSQGAPVGVSPKKVLNQFFKKPVYEPYHFGQYILE